MFKLKLEKIDYSDFLNSEFLRVNMLDGESFIYDLNKLYPIASISNLDMVIINLKKNIN